MTFYDFVFQSLFFSIGAATAFVAFRS